MKIRSLCLLAALCLPVLHAENLIINGDMKQNSGWRIWGSAPMQKEIRSKILTYPNAGPKQERVLQINDICDDHNPYAINFVFPPAIQKGQKYLLKFRANARQGQVFHVAMMGEIAKTATSPGKYLGGPSKTFTGTGKWQEYSHVFRDIPAGTNKLGVAFSPFPIREGPRCVNLSTGSSRHRAEESRVSGTRRADMGSRGRPGPLACRSTPGGALSVAAPNSRPQLSAWERQL